MASYTENFAVVTDAFPMCYQSQTAAGAGDNTEVTPPNSCGNVHPANSALDYTSGVLVLSGLASIASGKHLTLVTVKQSDSADGTTWGSDTTLSAYSSTVLVTGTTSGATWSYQIPINLKNTKAYVRFKITLDMDASGTDTNVWSAVLQARRTEIGTQP